METGEGHEVDGELSEIRVELTGETEATGDTGESGGDEMVKITVGGGGDLGGRHDREGAHLSVGVLLTNLGDEEGAHAGAGTTTEGVGDLEALEAIATLSLLTDDVEDGVDELGTF